MTTRCEAIVDQAADGIVDIAARDKPLDFEPFTDQQYEEIKAEIKLAIERAAEEIVGEIEAWAE